MNLDLKKNKIMFLRIVSIITLALSIAISCSSESESKNSEISSENGTAVISFSKLEHDFGKVTEGEKVACVFKFTNTGDGDLLINSATTSCGCAVPKFDKKPIKPGNSGTLEVVFDSSNYEGKQTKTVTVRSNASSKVMVLRVIAQVENNK